MSSGSLPGDLFLPVEYWGNRWALRRTSWADWGAPSYRSFPCSRMRHREVSCRNLPIRCSITMTVLPLRLTSDRAWRTLSTASQSRSPYGSSRSKTEGFRQSTDAIATRRFSPPDRVAGERSRRSSNFNVREISWIRLSISTPDKPRLSKPKAISSSTVLLKSWASAFCSTRPT